LPLSELLPGIDFEVVHSRSTTQMRNLYGEGPRLQFVPQRAAPLTPDYLPPDWRNIPIVLLGPVIGEVDEAMAARFVGSMLGIAAAFLIRPCARGHVCKATRFATSPSSFSVEGEGTTAIPTRNQIEARLKEHPNITAR